MQRIKILVPYNFTTYDQKSLKFVVNTFAHNRDADVTLLSAHTPLPEIEDRNAPVMARLKSSLNYLSQQNMAQENALQDAAKSLVQSGFSMHRVRAVFLPRKKDIATEIIQFAKADNFNLIIVNHKSKKATHYFTGHVFNKIITALTDITVCVIT
ncbi:MAG: hypothetical protein DSY90_10695 [Deltaproteobacteria bacterium]|nr:MAG: hypothetical protein DSY90_10695 [Deltaproteobacteria bacterium]